MPEKKKRQRQEERKDKKGKKGTTEIRKEGDKKEERKIQMSINMARGVPLRCWVRPSYFFFCSDMNI